MSARFSAALGLFVASFTFALHATAQSTGNNKAAAEALFEEGKKLYQQGQYEQACAKFAASEELDQGFGTLMNLGECYEKRGMTASAWATFKEAKSLAHTKNQADREASARARAAALEPRLSSVALRVGDAVAALPGLEIRLNGTLLPRAVWSSPVPVDPGAQRLELRAPGYKPFARELNVAQEGAPVAVEVSALEPEAASPPPEAAPVAVAEAPKPVEPSQAPTSESSAGSTQRTLGYVTASAGLAGVVVGSIFGLSAISKNSESEDKCRTESLCSPEGLTLREEAQDAAGVSTVAFVVGGALLAGGVTLVLTAPSAAQKGALTRGAFARRGHQYELRALPLLAPREAGLLVRGTF